MTTPYNQLAYGQGQGTAQIPAFIFEARDPTENDYNSTMKMYTGWVNTTTKAVWYLEALNASSGVITAQWRAVGPIVVSTVNPTSSDYQYPIGQTWINTSAMIYWGLVNVTGTTATWEDLSTGVSTGILTLTGNSGGAVSGDGARNVNIIGSSGVDIVGNPGTNTLTVSLSGGSQAIDSVGVDTFTGPGTNPVLPTAAGLITVTGAQVAASTTANVVRTASLAANTYTVQVQRSKAEPAPVSGSNGVAHFNSADFTVDNNAFVSLVSPGNTAITNVSMQIFTANGTYTPTPGMKYCQIEVVGGGGGGGAAGPTGAGQISAGGGGGGGGFAKAIFSAATIGASKAVTIGAGGAADTTGVGGGTGGTTSVGVLIAATGGTGGGYNATNIAIGGTAGSGSIGSFQCAGTGGGDGVGVFIPPGSFVQASGFGGATVYGGGGDSKFYGPEAGADGNNYGGGGSGAVVPVSTALFSGGAGRAGVVVITEYI